MQQFLAISEAEIRRMEAAGDFKGAAEMQAQQLAEAASAYHEQSRRRLSSVS